MRSIANQKPTQIKITHNKVTSAVPMAEMLPALDAKNRRKKMSYTITELIY